MAAPWAWSATTIASSRTRRPSPGPTSCWAARASTTRPRAAWRAFLLNLVPDPPDSPQGQTRATKVREEINRIYHGHTFGQDDVRGTAWGAWQAVVACNDHAMTSRRTRTSTAAETRFERILGGDNIGNRALALLS
jgi:Domain of unknown function (DUF932)